MKKITILLALALTAATALDAKKLPKQVTIADEQLMDKIRGAWAGQIIGCTYGGPTEFKYATTINDKIDIKWNQNSIQWYYDHAPGLYDDVYMDLTFVDVFDKEGLDAPVESFAKAFANAGYPLWHANQAARYNILQGVMPPKSGYWECNPHADDIDFQIEADYAGIMAPGMPNAASHYTDEIGHMMNYGDGWYGGVYVASMYALAFVSDDMEFVVSEALKSVPAQSKYYKCMADIIKWHKQYPEAWELTWALVNKHYGFDVGCPDGAYNAFNIDAVLNSAYIVIGLLYGEKDFYKTIDISTRCGADSDCNPASSGGILGAMLGYDAIPEYWKSPLAPVADRPFKYTEISFNKACELSFNQAKQVIGKNGGKLNDGSVTIAVQTPQAVRFEESFTGHYPVEVVGIKKYVNKVKDFEFTGNGIVVKYGINKGNAYDEESYDALVDVYLDGEKVETAVVPCFNNHDRRLELFWKYNLPVEKHKLSFVWTNPVPGVDIVVNSAVIYSDKLPHTEHAGK